MKLQQGIHGNWASRWTFIFAATGAAVGLANIWKFPYIAGENGGGAFVLVYLFCVGLIGIPIMIAEALIGRRGRMSPINSMLYVATESNVSSGWSVVGGLGLLAGLCILSFYSVIAGWALHYWYLAFNDEFYQITAKASGFLFEELLSRPAELIAWHSAFILLAVAIVAAGVVKGLGRAVMVIMPLFFVLLAVLLFYSVSNGAFAASWQFLLSFDSSSLEWSSILVALGHAFFTLSIGMGAIMAYGAYIPHKPLVDSNVVSKAASDVGENHHQPRGHPKKLSIARMVLTIAALDTIVAIAVSLIIFSVVFSSPELQASGGPGLLFVSLPVALGGMEGGYIMALLFFGVIVLVALSSAIAILEPTVAWLVEKRPYSRGKIALCVGFFAWFVGLGTVFSFNEWKQSTMLEMTFFDSLNFLTSNIVLPLAGLCIAIFVGWRMRPLHIIDEVGPIDQGPYKYWLRTLRVVSPVLLLIVFVMGLLDKFL